MTKAIPERMRYQESAQEKDKVRKGRRKIEEESFMVGQFIKGWKIE